MLAVFKRELRAYFTTPTGFIYLSLFLLLSGFFFMVIVLFPKNPQFSQFISNILFIYLLVVPVLTMRLFSEEKRQKTDQLLLTSPVKIHGIILGKFLAALVLFLVTIFITILYAVLVSFHGRIDSMETVSSYIGFLLVGGAFISIGIFISSLTENQVISAIITFFSLLLTWILDLIKQVTPTSPSTGLVFMIAVLTGLTLWIFISMKNWIILAVTAVIGITAIVLTYLFAKELYIGLIAKILNWFSLKERFDSFSVGVVKLSDIVYYISFIAFFLFMTTRVIEKNRWM